MVNILIVGGTGNVGSAVVEQALQKGHNVHAIVRSTSKFNDAIMSHANFKHTIAPILEMPNEDLSLLVTQADVLICTLGHDFSKATNLFTNPSRLVTPTIKRFSKLTNGTNTKLLMLNTVGCDAPDGSDPQRSLAEVSVLKLLGWTLPPFADSKDSITALYEIGTSVENFEWCVVRPDSLIPGDVCPYTVQATLGDDVRLFSPQQTTRANIADFMCNLIEDPVLWKKWHFKFPIIYETNLNV